LQHVTHELKTPLASINEATALLIDEIPGAINDKQRAVLLLLDKNIHVLSDSIGHLLNYNALSHRAAASVDTIHLPSFFATQIASLQDMAATKALRWEITADDLSIQADVQYLTMAIINLLSNAVKFSPRSGKIVIDWRLGAARDQVRNRVSGSNHLPENRWANMPILLISIIDQGPGIPLTERNEVIKPFYQGNHKINGARRGRGIGLATGLRRGLRAGLTTGFGMGLAIVHECVTAMRGRLEIKDAEGGGTHISVRIPVFLVSGKR
jgi:two-component system sensor histidine kinase GlrK